MEIRVNETVLVSEGYTIEALLFSKHNKCCSDRPVVLTKSPAGVFSCQCSCGAVCTSGYESILGAVAAWDLTGKRV